MRAASLACGLALVAALGACAGPGGGSTFRPAAVAAVPPEPSAKDVAKLVSRSVWGVVPDAPKRKQDLRPELIRGSAVAVADGTLLASCRVVGKRAQVGLVRHNKYRIAKVRALDKARRVCVLEADDAPVNVAAGFRSAADLRPGEPVYAIVSRTSAELAVAEGRVAGRRETAGGLIEADLALPAGARSAVLVDARGNLVGLGSGETRGDLVLAAPVTARAAPRLANRDLGATGGERQPTVRLAALARPAPGQARPAFILFRDEPDRDGGGGGAREVATATAARAEAPDQGTAGTAAGGADGTGTGGGDPDDGDRGRGGRGGGRDADGSGRNDGDPDAGSAGGGRGSGLGGLGGLGGGFGGFTDGGGRGRNGDRDGGRDDDDRGGDADRGGGNGRGDRGGDRGRDDDGGRGDDDDDDSDGGDGGDDDGGGNDD